MLRLEVDEISSEDSEEISIVDMSSFGGVLFQRNKHLDWVEFHVPVQLDVYSGGIIIRELQTQLLLSDFPKSTILCIEKVPDSSIFRISCQNSAVIAVRITGNIGDSQSFINLIKRLKIFYQELSPPLTLECLDHDGKLPLPDLKDTSVQKQLLSLLFSEEFQDFAENVAKIIKTIESCATQSK